MTELTFAGTPEQQSLAAEVFRLMSFHATFYAEDTLIRQNLTNLSVFLGGRMQRDPEALASEIDTALSLNAAVFGRETDQDDVVFVTSRRGVPYELSQDNRHNFRQRLYEPENPLPVHDISVVVSTSRPTLTTVEPVFISDYWQEQAGLVPLHPEDMPGYDEADTSDLPLPDTSPVTTPADLYTTEVVLPPTVAAPDASPLIGEAALVDEDAAEPATARPLASEPEVAAAEASPALAMHELTEVLDEQQAQDVAPEIAAITPEPPAAATPPAAPPAPEPLVLPEHLPFVLPDGTELDLAQPLDSLLAAHGASLKQSFVEAIDRDPLRRLVRFGDRVYPELSLINLGKNDLRRIRDDIIEAQEPLTDTAIISDLYYNQHQTDYEKFRFSLNYRLSREKDFEFVGIDGALLWATKGLPSVGTKRIKAGEMAQMTSFLVEGYDDSLRDLDAAAIRESGSINRLLTFFEWSHGVLAFDASLAALLPPPFLADQRSAMLRFESPQHYLSYVVEVRYPTHNRGGWLQGLDEFFSEYLVAGALMTISRTEEPGIFTITYDETSGDTHRILTVDEKKNRLTYSDVSYYSAVQPDFLLTQERYGRLRNLKMLTMSDRRKAELVLQHAFEAVGDKVGSREAPAYQLELDTLHVAYNVLRPGSRSFLQALLAANPGLYQQDADGLEIYTYTPEIVEKEEEDDTPIFDYADDEDE